MPLTEEQFRAGAARIETLVHAFHAFMEEEYPDEPWSFLAGALGIAAMQIVSSGPEDGPAVEYLLNEFVKSLQAEIPKAVRIRRDIDAMDAGAATPTVN